MMDGSTVPQQLETITAAVGLFLLHQQLCGLFQDEAMEPDSKFLGSFQNKNV